MAPRLSTTTDRAIAALQRAIKDPGTTHSRAAAEALVALRQHFTHEGIPDWAGRSPEYRDLIERVYRKAGVPSDSQGGIQANLRYHLGNVIRQVAPPEHLDALGLAQAGPLARVKQTRQEQGPRSPRRRPPSGPLPTPEALAVLALACMQAVTSAGDLDSQVAATTRLVLDECLAALGVPA